ncbi:MAG: response regulator [Cyanobacteria bacterium P01_C01_bin.118]
MHEPFEVISFFDKILKSGQAGRVHITSNGVEWCLDILDGKLLFAAHSLQYLNTLETTLPSLGYEAVLPIYWRLTQLDIYKRQIDHIGLTSLNWTSKIVGALIQYNVLSLERAEKILVKLAEDATESLLGLEQATLVWHPLPKELWHFKTQGRDITSLVKHISEIRRSWQPLCDLICSPHQRPYCESPDELYQPTPQGLLSQPMLESLARLMQGASIRQLAQALKQDEVKLAQLLYPYIKHRTIKLWPPLQPLDRLPWLPTKQQSSSAVDAVAQTPETTEPVSNGRIPTDSTLTDSTPTDRIPQPPVQDPSPETDETSSAATFDTQPEASSNEASSKNSTFPNNNGTDVARPKHLIVCIDDSQAMLEKIESYLDPKYFEIKTIIDPVKSVSKICITKPSLVLMDISMPSINGNSLCSILKRSYMFKDVPIIMISSNSSALNKAKAEVSGAADYLEKPFSKDQLLKLLETHLKPELNKV